MKTIKTLLYGLTITIMGTVSTFAQSNKKFFQPRELIQVSSDDVQLDYNQLSSSVIVQAKSAYELYCRSSWLKAEQEGNTIKISATENELFVPRTAKIILTTKKENVSRVINVTQKTEPGHDRHFALPTQGNIYPMVNMDLSKATHDSFISQVLKNRAVESETVRIKNNTYETSVCTHAPSTFKIQLNGAMHFVTDLGIDDQILKKNTSNHGDAKYKFLLDGKEVASGRITVADNQVAHIDIDTHGAKILEIIFDTNGSNWGDHIDMGNPYFELTADKPVLID